MLDAWESKQSTFLAVGEHLQNGLFECRHENKQ